VQGDSWGYVGQIDDAPAVNVLADDVLIEFNTITCSGFDDDICSRGVRLGGDDAVVRFNDISFARGGVAMFRGAEVSYNYLHDFAFGADARQRNASNNPGVTHNNVFTNQGYEDVLIEGNYVVASYGRVSATPGEVVNQQYSRVYGDDGVVEVGDPINGFGVTNSLNQGSGAGLVVLNNYFESVGRPFYCNTDGLDDAQCADELGFNIFAGAAFDAFDSEVPFEIDGGFASLSGRCNSTAVNADDPVPSPLSASAFPGDDHGGGDECVEWLELGW